MTSIEVIPQTVEAKENSEVQLTVSVLPEDATNPVVGWSSSDETIATVDDTGLVKVLKEEQAKITATTTDGTNLSASCVLTATSEIVEVENQDFLIKVDGNNIIVCDTRIGETIRVFAADGSLVAAKEVSDTTMIISVPIKGVYIVAVGSYREKVLVK